MREVNKPEKETAPMFLLQFQSLWDDWEWLACLFALSVKDHAGFTEENEQTKKGQLKQICSEHI